MNLNKKIVLGVLLFASAIILVPIAANALTLNLKLNINVMGIFLGFLHGLLAPYSLVLRWFIPDISMYSYKDASWLYDFGFLIGVFFSLPLGWIAVIIALLFHLFAY